jgi:hypothetical protein
MRTVNHFGCKSTLAATVALAALLAIAPFASAAGDPLAGGTTAVKLNRALVTRLKRSGIKVLGVSPANVTGAAVTLPVGGGSIDPVTGLGTVEHRGGIKFKAGKKSASVTGLLLGTRTASLNAEVAGKKMKFASVKGVTTTRDGFGAGIRIGSLKLTGKAARQLNEKLGVRSFKGNQALGGALSEAQPKTVAVIATGDAQLVLSSEALTKLALIGPESPPASGNHPFAVKLAAVDPAKIVALSSATAVFPIGGGDLAPTAASGILRTGGGLTFTQNLEGAPPPSSKGVTVLSMGNIWVNLGAKTASVEVTISNEKSPELNKGGLGRASIAEISLTGAAISADPTTRTISVQNAAATLQATTAEVLNAVFVEPIEGKGKGIFAGGDPLGVFSFTARTR